MGRYKEELKLDEGLRLKAYQDHLGVWTIGYGTNLQTLRITEAQAEKWLDEKITEVDAQVASVTTFAKLDSVRKDVIRSMIYQLGFEGTLNFKRMVGALKDDNYRVAAAEMRDSKWWREDTPKRAERMAKRMESGVW